MIQVVTVGDAGTMLADVTDSVQQEVNKVLIAWPGAKLVHCTPMLEFSESRGRYSYLVTLVLEVPDPPAPSGD